uniref:Permease n=1 Tax=Solibacter usitatus (strain Ellin6076) TaxID=234267 RepID=Q01Y15_SOLUE
MLEGTLYDLRFAVRGLARNPGFAVTAVLAAALGIGASTAVFSAVDRILFRPLPYSNESRLVSIGIMAPLDRNEFMFASGYFDLRRNLGPFEQVTSFQAGNIPCDLTEHNPVRLECLRIEANFLETLGMAPAVGRMFNADEDRPNGPGVAVISYALWQQRFGADPSVAGRTLMLDGAPVRITGVLPKDFLMPTLTTTDILLPEQLDESRERMGRAFRVFGRLKEGTGPEQARAMLQPYFARVLETVPAQFRKEVSLRIRPVRDRQVGDVRLAALTLLGAVLSVLLIACANIANLLLARAAGRTREMAVRRALGASRMRLARQVLTESLLLGALGGAAGCAMAWILLRVFQGMAPGGLPRLQEAGVDWRVLLFAVAASIGAALLFGMAPALGRGRPTSRSRGWMRGGLVTAQIAISVILVTGAGLLLRSLWNLESVQLGIERDHVMTAKFVLGRQRYNSSAEQLAFFDNLERRLRALPGVSAAAISDSLPPSGGTRGRPFSTIEVPGKARLPEGTGGMVMWRYITPDYFQALGITIRRGRGFGDEDRAAGARSIVVSETLSRMLFGGEEAIGRQVSFAGRPDQYTVIGVASDARNTGLETRGAPEYYEVRKAVADAAWANQEPPIGWRAAQIVVRTPVDPRLAAGAVRGLFAELDPTLPVELETMRKRLDGITARPRFQATLLSVFAVTGLALAGVGLFGVMSFLVAQRRKEIGVRMALGATPADIVRLTLVFAARWTGAGMAAGALGALALTKWLRTLTFGISGVDPGTLSAALAVLAIVGLVAAAAPARRAARLDPMTTLREE